MNARNSQPESFLANRFRGYLPVVVDVETTGLNAQTDALLEIAIVLLTMDEPNVIKPAGTYSYHIHPFPGATFNPVSLKLNKIDPHHPFRFAIQEKEALEKIFEIIRRAVKAHQCQRAILVGHNAWFDLMFLQAAITRCQIKRNPFHAFSTFDTATLGGLAYGQTVLARALEVAGIEFDRSEAHSAIYDAEKTAELFCNIVNLWDQGRNKKSP